MTFFNVISALLFFGSLQQLILAADAGSISKFLMAATLTVLVFNDAVYTSHVVEGEKTVKYKLSLMLVDLLNFLLLSCAILVINPEHNAFDISLVNLGRYTSEWHFWAIVAAYWLMVMFWTYRAGIYSSDYPRGLLISSFVLALLFGIQAVLAARDYQWLASVGRVLALAYLLLHIVVMRPWMYRFGAKLGALSPR